MQPNTLILVSLLFLLIISQNFSFTNARSIKLTNTRNLAGYYNTAGSFQLVQAEAGIVQQQPGVFVTTYFDDGVDGGSGELTFNTKGGTMMLALYTSQTLVSIDCENYNNYNCSTYNCQVPTQTNTNIDYPEFSAQGGLGHAFVYIDINYWNLTTPAFFASDCSSYKHDTYGTETYGLLALGVSGDNIKNFVTTQTYGSVYGGTETSTLDHQPVFSFFLLADGLSGELIFDNDETRAYYSEPQATLLSDYNWNVQGVTGLSYGTVNFDLPNSTLIFDINSDALGFPLNVYNELILAINGSIDTLVCPTDVTYKPVCQFTESISYLPTLTIIVNGQSIPLPSSVYATVITQIDRASDSIILNLRGLSEENLDGSFATETYENYVILDQHVMGYYYTVFDTTRTSSGDNLHIMLYIANHGSSSNALLIILIGTAIGLGVGFFVWRQKKIKKARMMAERGSLYELNEVQGQRARGGYQELR